MDSERKQWLKRTPNEALSKKLGIAAWIITAAVLGLVALMRGPKLPLPDGWSFAFLPPIHALLNSLVALSLVAALVAVKRGKVIMTLLALTVSPTVAIVAAICYVAYHFTMEETRFPKDAPHRGAYLILLISHITLAAVSLPFILFTFIAGWTNRFAAHRRLARWVFPLWLYVAITGPICYWMLRPYY